VVERLSACVLFNTASRLVYPSVSTVVVTTYRTFWAQRPTQFKGALY
jgi:hypothetical protein